MSRFTRWSRVSPLALCLERERLAWRCAWGLLSLFSVLVAVSLFWRTAARPSFGAECGVCLRGVWVEETKATEGAVRRCCPMPLAAVIAPVETEVPAFPIPPVAEPQAVAALEDAAALGEQGVENPLALELPSQLADVLPAPRHRAVAARSAPQDAGVFIPASYCEAPPPPYPPSLRSRRLSGKVALRIELDAAGVPQRVEVCRAASHAEFDRCAREWVLAHWRFYPARRGGVAVPSVVRTQVAFVVQ